MSRITTTTLACGMPLIVERIPGMRSVGLTWLVPAGSSRDPEDRQGISAMWSELLHRGAAGRSSREQADDFDRLGVGRNANVETFHMGIGATMLGSNLGAALPLIVDMVRRPNMDAASVEPARDLCLQSIEGLADDPQERVMVLLRRNHAPPPLNRPSIGTTEGIEAVRASELLPEWNRRAVPGGSVMALAGDVDAGRAAEALNRLLDGWSGSASEVVWTGEAPRGYYHEPDETNQVHIALGHDAPAEPDADCWPERIVTAVLSGGMSGRLFTEVREKRSLCYSVYASYGADAKYGRTVAYVGTTPERAQESLDVLLGELGRINTPEGRVTEGEFQRAAMGMKSRLVMSGESTGARAGALARDWHKLGRPRSLEELTASIDALRLEDVNAYLSRRSLGRTTIATIGPAALEVRV